MHVFSSLFFFGQAWLIILGFSMIIHVPCMFFLLIFSFAMHGKLSLDYAYLSSCCYQRWSRGHKARGQGQGHKKIRGQGQGQPFRGQTLSRPRTGMLEAKAKDQGHSRKCFPQKKVFKIFFQALSNL